MSEPQEPNAGPEPETTDAPAKGRREPQPGDVPKPIVWAVIIVAVLVSGAVGWKRYQALREETRKEMQALREAEQRRMAEERERAREQREAQAATEAAAGEAAAPSAAGEGGDASAGKGGGASGDAEARGSSDGDGY